MALTMVYVRFATMCNVQMAYEILSKNIHESYFQRFYCLRNDTASLFSLTLSSRHIYFTLQARFFI